MLNFRAICNLYIVKSQLFGFVVLFWWIPIIVMFELKIAMVIWP